MSIIILSTGQVWHKQDASGRPSPDHYDWTPINGGDRVTLLKRLPPMIPSLVSGGNPDGFRQVFEVWYHWCIEYMYHACLYVYCRIF